MKIKNLAFSLVLGAAAASLRAQQSMPDMPGMQTPAQKPAAPLANRMRQSPGPEAPDLQGMAQDGECTSHVSDARHGAPRLCEARSIQIPVQELQEPEAIGFHTGSDLPAPELLHDVVPREPMALESFLALADQTNPTLRQAQSNVERSRQQARQMGLPPNPVVGYSGEHIRGGEYHGGEQGAFFSQEFLLGRKLALRRNIYLAEGRANGYGVAIQRARIHNDVARAFFDTLAAQQAVVVQDRLLKVALDAEANAHELERVGQADASDVLNAEIAAEQAKVEFVNAQRMFLGSFTQLATDAGQNSLAPHPLTGSLVQPPELDAEMMVLSDMQESPEVKQAEATVAVAEARVKSARRENIPNLNVKAGEWYSGEDLGATNIRAGWMSFAEVGVQVPLWNRNQGNTGAAQVDLDRARQEVTRTQLVTRNRAEPLAQQYQTARFTAERYRTEMLPRARRAYEMEVTKYQQMAQAYSHVLAAQHMLFMLQLTYIHSLQEQWQAAIALQNFTLQHGLEEPVSAGPDATTMNLPTTPGGGN